MNRYVRLVIIVWIASACEGPATELIVPLAVINWYPSGNAICVPRETGIWVTFSEPVIETTLTADSVALLRDNDSVSVTRQYDAETWTVHLQPAELLELGTDYVVRLQPTIESGSGGTFNTEVESSFTTLPQSGCASGMACQVDAHCHPQLCSVTGACVNECAVPEDCLEGQVCVADSCQDPSSRAKAPR